MNFQKGSVIELDDDDSSLLSSSASSSKKIHGFSDKTSKDAGIHSMDCRSTNDEASMMSSCLKQTYTADWSSSDDEKVSILSVSKCKPKSVPSHTLTFGSSDTDSDDDDSLADIKSKLAASASCKLYTSLSQSSHMSTKYSCKSATQKTAPSHLRRPVGKDRINVAGEKQVLRQRKNEERLRLKAEKESAKHNAKLERERQREEKKNAQLEEKQSKKRDREACQQASGKLAKKEIAVLLQKELFASFSCTVVDDLEKMSYFVQDYPSALQCNAVQWIRHDALHGGAVLAVQQLQGPAQNREFQHFPVLTIVVDDAPAFIKLLERSADEDEEDDYPALEEWLKGIEYGWKAAWKTPAASTHVLNQASSQQPRIILLLVRITEGLDKIWLQYHKDVSNGRASAQSAPPTAEVLHDAITWILIQFQIECVHCKSADDVSTHLCKITRLLAESPYRQPVTEFSCIKKIKGNAGNGTDEETFMDRATDCWIRQLQQIPRISQARAMHFSSFYPTAMSLWMAYQDNSLSIQQKRSLVADCFHPKNSYLKLSEQLYTVMTSQDPNQMVT
jgi:hypothetical protein